MSLEPFPGRRTLVLATHNAKKRLELQSVLDPQGGALALVDPVAGGVKEPDEPYGSFVENALHKARVASKAMGLPAVADDSGLSVRALDGAPGVQSAHFAGVLSPQVGEDREGLRRRQDAANIERLLECVAPLRAALPGSAVSHRRLPAAFVCTLVAVRHPADPEPLVAQGRWELELLEAPQGEGGFGYDPLMWLPSHACTVAELPAAEKNRLSHRALAAGLLRQQLIRAWGWMLPGTLAQA